MFSGAAACPGEYPSIEPALDASELSTRVGASKEQLRHEKFADLADFFDFSQANPDHLPSYGPAARAELGSGSIIHIHDIHNGYRSRIHNCIMLVVRLNAPVSMTCYSLDRHDPPLSSQANRQTHWKVIGKGQSHIESNPATLTCAEVELNYGARPRCDITINLRDPWNIEYEVDVAKLGDFTPQAYRAARKRINELFQMDSFGPSLSVGSKNLDTTEVPLERFGSGAINNSNDSHEMRRSKTDSSYISAHAQRPPKLEQRKMSASGRKQSGHFFQRKQPVQP